MLCYRTAITPFVKKVDEHGELDFEDTDEESKEWKLVEKGNASEYWRILEEDRDLGDDKTSKETTRSQENMPLEESGKAGGNEAFEEFNLFKERKSPEEDETSTQPQTPEQGGTKNGQRRKLRARVKI